MECSPTKKKASGTDFAEQLAEIVHKATALLPSTVIAQCRPFHGIADMPDVKIISTTTCEATDADA